jgi:hypothetical protein
MRKIYVLLIILMLLLLCVGIKANAQTWATANQKTVGWDAGDLATSYDVFIVKAKAVIEDGVETWIPDGDPILIGNTTELHFTITFPEGRYFAGVQSIRDVDGERIPSDDIAWSYLELYCKDGITFGIKNWNKPESATGMRIQ